MSAMVNCFGCEKEIHVTADTCPSCGAVQVQAIKKDVSKSNFKWSWWSPLICAEYASRGMIGMGVLMAFVNFFPPSIVLSSLALKNKSIKDLSATEFKWNKGAISVMALQILIWLTILSNAKK